MLRPGLSISVLLWLCSATSTAIAQPPMDGVSGAPRRSTSSSRSTSSPSTTFNNGQYVSWQPPATDNVENTPLPSDSTVPSAASGLSATLSLPASDPPINTEDVDLTLPPSSLPLSPSSLPGRPPNSPMNTDNPEIEKSTQSPSLPPSSPSPLPASNSPINTESENVTPTLPPPSATDSIPPSPASNSPPATNKPMPISSPSKDSTTSSSAEVHYGLGTQITVSKPPTICTASHYKWEKQISLPTPGVVLVMAGKTGWGDVGAVWELRPGPDAKLIDVHAKAQGSSGTSVNPNQEFDGGVKRLEDGSYQFNVTEGMQPSLKIHAVLVGKDTPVPSSNARKRSRGRPSPEMRKRDSAGPKLSLTVTGMPECGLPIAHSCDKSKFSASKDQWEAYRVDEFMEWWVHENEIADFQTFREKAYKEFVDPQESMGTTCAVDGGHACAIPDKDSCTSMKNKNETQGFIMATAAAQFTTFLQKQWTNVNNLRGVVSTDIHQIVKNNWVNSAKQTTAKILSMTGALMGIIVAACVALTVIFPTAAWAGWSVAGAILAQTAVSAAGAAENMLDPGSSDAQFTKSTEWEKQGDDMVIWLSNGLLRLHDGKTEPKNVIEAMKGGMWVSDEVHAYNNKNGKGKDSQNWFERSIITAFITKALKEEDAYIVFFPYDDKVDYNGKAWKQGAFDKEMCVHHFVGNKGWKYYATCDIPFGAEEGMAVVTRPSSKGSESQSWMEEPLSFGGKDIEGTDIMRSAMTGQDQHGFNYTIMNEDFIGLMEKDVSLASKMFSNTAVDQPGLFPVPVCVVRDDLVYVPGIHVLMHDIYDTPGSGGFYHYDAPVPCKDYKSDKGDKRQFTDFVSDTVRDSFDTKLKGHIYSDEMGDGDDIVPMGGGV